MGEDIQFERDLLRARHLQVGACRLDRALNEVRDDDRRTHVMPKAAAVLDVLIHFAGRPVSKERLLLEVWRGDFPTEDVVTNAISQLRKAFGDGARDSRYIRTVPRVGYALLAEVRPVPDDISLVELVDAPVDTQVDEIVDAFDGATAGSVVDAIEVVPMHAAMVSSAPARRFAHTVWIALFFILLALAIGILIGGTQWRAAHVPHHAVPLGEHSLPTNVTYRHSTPAPQATVAFSLGFRRDADRYSSQSSMHEQRTRSHAWM